MTKPPFDPARPDTFPGRTKRIEKGTPPERGLFPYRSDYEVQCAFCDSHQKHRRGWVVETADGRVALLGIDCASKHLGVDTVRELQRGLAQFERRQKTERQLGNLLIGVEEALEQIEQWLPFDNQLSQAISEMHYAWRYLRPSMDFAGFPSDHSSLLSAASKLTLIQRARDGVTLKDWEMKNLAKGRSDAIANLGAFVRRCESARKFFSRHSLRRLSHSYVEEPARLEWRENSIFRGVVIDPGRGRDRIYISVPDLSKIPTQEEMIGSLRNEQTKVAAA